MREPPLRNERGSRAFAREPHRLKDDAEGRRAGAGQMRDCLVRKANRTISHADVLQQSLMQAKDRDNRLRINDGAVGHHLHGLLLRVQAYRGTWRLRADRGTVHLLESVARYSAVYCEEKLGVLMKRVNWVSFEAS